VLKDVSKASRCYQKAFDLDPNSNAAGIALGDSLMELEDEVDKTVLLTRCFWLLVVLTAFKVNKSDLLED